MVKNTEQKGAIMLELMAVLMLLGALGPMLFRQIQDRNEDLHNINYAAEMRALKEGFTAYIIANQEILRQNCFSKPTDDFTADYFKTCDNISVNNVVPYLPNTENPGDNFTFILQAALQSDSSTNIVYQGFIIPKNTGMPENLKLRRAARIANLIGADGGVYGGETTDHNIYGALGAWAMDGSDIINEAFPTGFSGGTNAVYIATTGVHSFSPRVIVEPSAEKSTYIPDDLAFQKLHAWNFFSVGGGTDGCYTKNTDGSVTFKKTKDCTPLFWVNQSSSGETDGHVHVRNNLYVGQKGSETEAAIALAEEDGSGSIKIKAPDNDTLTIKDGQIISDRITPDGDNYVLDPSHTSIMNDIRLVSRGNARLSEILPKYIAKAVIPLEGNSVNVQSFSVDKPKCPNDDETVGGEYVPAIIVTPTRWDSAAVTASTPPISLGFSVEIDDKASGFSAKDTPIITSSTTWRIRMGYKQPNTLAGSGNFQTTLNTSKFAAIVQTFCVWDETSVAKDGKTYKNIKKDRD